MSQTIAADALHTARFQDGATILFVSRSLDAAINLLEYCKDILTDLDDGHSVKVTRRGSTKLSFSNGSRIMSVPATQSTGRTYAATKVYLDEAAFLPWADTIYTAISPTVARGGQITIGSTPNGQGNFFHALCKMGSYGLVVPFYEYADEGWSMHLIHWKDCPAYDKIWYERERPKYNEVSWYSEFECVTPDTPVYIENHGFVRIADVHGGSVMNADASTNRIEAVSSRPYDGEVLAFDVAYSPPLVVTPNHPLFSPDRNDFQRADRFLDSDYLYRPRPGFVASLSDFDLASVGLDVEYNETAVCLKNGRAKSVPRFIPANEDCGRLIGYYLAEGSIGSGGKSVDFSFGKKDIQRGYVADLRYLLVSLFGLYPTITQIENAVRVNVSSKILAGFFVSLVGSGAYSKFAPDKLLFAQTDFVRGLAIGMFHGDGCETEHAVAYTTCSPALASAAYVLLSRFGNVTTIRSQSKQPIVSPTNGKEYPSKDSWDVRTSCAKTFTEAFDYDQIAKPSRDAVPWGNGWKLKIRSIVRKTYVGNVYNLSVENSHTFCASTVATHNCDFEKSGDPVFRGEDVKSMQDGWTGAQERGELTRSYVTAWDIGRRRDASVGITIDVTEPVHQIVKIERFDGASIPTIQGMIVKRYYQFPGRHLVEANDKGDAVIENIDLPKGAVEPFWTNSMNKSNMITALQWALESRMLKCDINGESENQEMKVNGKRLAAELVQYKWDDRYIQQDMVMALAIAEHKFQWREEVQQVYYDNQYEVGTFQDESPYEQMHVPEAYGWDVGSWR